MTAIVLLTAGEAAERLHVGVDWVYNAANNGRLSGIRHARRWYFTEDDIETYLAKCRNQTAGWAKPTRTAR